jgi:hypothetical protein
MDAAQNKKHDSIDASRGALVDARRRVKTKASKSDRAKSNRKRMEGSVRRPNSP